MKYSPFLVLENKITFAIITVAIAALVAGISTIVLDIALLRNSSR